MNDNATQLLYQKFAHHPIKSVSKECGIITACDQGYFTGFQLLYYSLLLNSQVPITLFDLGFSEAQKSWCKHHPLIKVVEWKDIKKELIFQVEDDPKKWQTWNKPVFFDKSPYRYTLWIDSDCIAMHPIHDLFDEMKKAFFIVQDQNPWYADPNTSHVVFNTNLIPHQSAPPLINAGVIGCDKERDVDKRLLKKWLHAVMSAKANENVRQGIPWHDQGSLQWALETESVLQLVSAENKWNETTYHRFDEIDRGSLSGFIKSLNTGLAMIAHLVYGIKEANESIMWKNWGEVPIQAKPQDFDIYRKRDDQESDEIMVFVLGHNKSQIERVNGRSYLQLVDLKNLKLPKSEWENNQLAENRIFLSPLVEDIKSQYVGFITASYPQKYPHIPLFNDINQLKPQLSPDTILVAETNSEQWAYHSEQSHPGIETYLEEISRITGLSLSARSSFWGNNFICPTSEFNKFLIFWRKQFEYLYNKYKFDFDFHVAEHDDPSRRAAYLYERLTTLYFANASHLKIVPITNRAIYHLTESPRDNLPYVICDYLGNIEAKLSTAKAAHNYCQGHGYLAIEKDVKALEED